MKNGNFDFFAMTLQTSCGAIRQRKRVTYKRLVVLKGLRVEQQGV